MRWFALTLLLAGCYSPSPPDGAYLCGAGDQACPTGQHCTCGQCVKNDSAAACGFEVVADSTDVKEHEPFAVTIRALDGKGATAAKFAGAVKLTASWGDVQPASVPLAGGVATAMVSLNRETLSPSVALVSASFAGQKGTSGGINVLAPPLMVMPTDAVTPPFGWARDIVTEANVIKEGAIWEMYFLGQSPAKYGVGLATSVDGKTFTPLVDPVLQSTNSFMDLLYSPTVFVTPTEHLMAYSVMNGIGLATSSDGKAFTPINGTTPVLADAACSYCSKGVTFPQVLPDPAGGYVMFFSAIGESSVSIGRASSTDGHTWTAEPAPLLSSGLSGEQILLSPRVMLDGTVWKMWYSYANLADLPSCFSGCPAGSTCNTSTATCVPTDIGDSFFSFCQATTRVQVGYATSADGFFWTKSIHNPALAVEAFAGDRAVLVSSVLPTDGVNGSTGTTLWYSPFRRSAVVANRCIPLGVRQAIRP